MQRAQTKGKGKQTKGGGKGKQGGAKAPAKAQKGGKKAQQKPKQQPKQKQQGKKKAQAQQPKGKPQQQQAKKGKPQKQQQGKGKGKASKKQVQSAKQAKASKKQSQQKSQKKKAATQKQGPSQYVLRKQKRKERKAAQHAEHAEQQKQQKTQRKKRPRNKNRKYRVRNTRLRGRAGVGSKHVLPDKLFKVLQPSEADIQKMLAAQVHIGRRRSHVNMKRYIWKRRQDGFNIINLEKTWHKILLAARIIVTVQNPKDVAVMSTRTNGQRGAIKFAHYTGATSMVGKWVAGTFCNPENKAFAEPRLLIVDDPSTCFAALRETSYMGIPVIAFSGVDNNTRFVDCAIPCNNRGKLSIGLIYWMLAREVCRMRNKALSRSEEWEAPVDLFFYRDADEIKKQQELQAKKEAEEQGEEPQEEDEILEDEPPVAEMQAQQYQPEYQEEPPMQPYYQEEIAGIPAMQADWDERPVAALDDWGAPAGQPQQQFVPQDAQPEYQYQPEAPLVPQQPQQGYGGVDMQQW